MKIAVYSDVHLMAPHYVSGLESEIQSKDLVKERYGVEDVFLTGDIIDVDNCKRKHLQLAKDRVKDLKKIHGAHYLLGNHECQEPERYFFKYKNVLFTHGHTLFWDLKKIAKWENKKGGMKWWRYKLYALTHHSGRNGKPLKLSTEKIIEFSSLAKSFGCNTIVFGHTHRVYDETYHGVRIINVPKGRTILDINDLP